MSGCAILFRDAFQPTVSAAIRDRVSALVEAVGSTVDLPGLDGITVACDYECALATLDRGALPTDGPSPTVERFGSGVAMAVWVERDGRLATHIVLDAMIATALVGGDDGAAATARFVVVHELGHVAEHGLAWAAFGAAVLHPFDDPYEAWLHSVVRRCWSEYYACRITGDWNPNQLAGFQALLAGALIELGQCDQRPSKASSLADDDQARELVERLGRLMAFCGQVIGHSHGIGRAADAGDAAGTLSAVGLGDWFRALEGELERCFIAFRRDPRPDMFLPLNRRFEDGFARFDDWLPHAT